MNLHSRSVAAPSGFRQTSRIALGKRTHLDEALKCQIVGGRNSFWRRISRGDSDSRHFRVGHWSGGPFRREAVDLGFRD
jgi:hypothetical protein